MTQWDILDYLQKSPSTWYDIPSLSDALRIRRSNIYSTIHRLQKAKLIKAQLQDEMIWQISNGGRDIPRIIRKKVVKAR